MDKKRSLLLAKEDLEELAKEQPLVLIEEKDLEAFHKALNGYKGHASALEMAIGSLCIGKHFGWRAVYMIHTRKAIDKYEKILGIKYKDVCVPETELTQRLAGIRIKKKWEELDFWRVIQGKMSEEQSREMGSKGDLV